MKAIHKSILLAVIVIMAVSCGRSGDPGHCYISIVYWEYWDEDYRVYYYDDNNPAIPESQFIELGYEYDSYPGIYEYYYEAEDPDEWFTYEGFYELLQNPGTPGGLFRDGWDGADTYFDLYLYVYARKGLTLKGAQVTKSAEQFDAPSLEATSRSGRAITAAPLRTETRSWETTDGPWTIRVTEEVKVYNK